MPRKERSRRPIRKLEEPGASCNSDSNAEDDSPDGENLENEDWLSEKDPFTSKKDDAISFRSSVFDDWKNFGSINLSDEEDDDNDYLLQEAIFASSQLHSRNANIPEVYKGDRITTDIAYASGPTDIKQKGICISDPLVPHFGAIDASSSERETGESSWSKCVICGDDKPTGALKQNVHCRHFFCEDCMRLYIQEKIQENTNIFHEKVKCPEKECKKLLSAQQLRPYIPEEVYDRILASAHESEVLANPRFIKCPLLFCSAKFVDDKKGFKIKACSECWRIFCVKCRMQWHMGKSCEEFQAELRALMSLDDDLGISDLDFFK